MQFDQLRRREFITLLGGAAAAWPIGVRAQQQRMPIVGFLRSAPLASVPHFIAAFRQGLNEQGFVEGRSVAIELRSAEDQPARLPALVADLLAQDITLIACDNFAARAAKAATTTVPIVFAGGGDPVQEGLVASLNHPGGNVTGVVFLTGLLGAKRLELLRQLAPKATVIALLVQRGTPQSKAERSELDAAAQKIGQQLLVFEASSDQDLETAFAMMAERGAGALLAGSGPFLYSHRERLVMLAARYRLPTTYSAREVAVDGGLMSYGTSLTDALRQAGVYAGRILKGEKPASLPVMQATKFELVINLKTAKALGLAIPDKLLALADEVIE
jgi:putative tryptophan/tyrosine transport system substrate-binding protein